MQWRCGKTSLQTATTEMTKRIQMSRRKGGWRKDHRDAVIVARPSKWRNPYRVGVHGAAAECVKKFADVLTGLIDNTRPPCPPVKDLLSLDDYAKTHLHELRGKDLACWCPLGQSCHADVLLKIANEDT